MAAKNVSNLRRSTVLVRAKNKKLFDRKVGIVMGEFKKGKLYSSSGKKVTDKDQALAIALSEARNAVLQSHKKKKSS